jgi:hypothetical protein
MTAQVRDILLYNGTTYHIATEPLKQLFEIMGDDKPKLISPHTACWRGYVGTWQIEEDKLYLIDFQGHGEKQAKVGMEYIFPGQIKVFAEWYTGEIRIPHGELLHYEHRGYLSIYEKELFLEFKKGILISTRELDNTKTFDPEDPIGWGKVQRDLYGFCLKDHKKGISSNSDDKDSD